MFTETFGTENVSVSTPAGSVAPFLGAIDPSGWVIADGAGRPNTFGLYNDLLSIGVGSELNNVYYPPNFKGAFLRGTGTSGGYAGPSLNQSQFHATQTHNHFITDPGHTHGATNAVPGGPNVPYGDITVVYTNVKNVGGASGSNTKNQLLPNGTGISIDDSSSTIVNSINRYADTNETRPYNYGVNWIIKL
jgi:hypothetical protein